MRNRKHYLILVAFLAAAPAFADAPPVINLRRTVTVEVVERTKDAVVNIAAEKVIAQRQNPFGNDAFFRDFGRMALVPANSLGSGFIVHSAGYVVTNNHVIDRANKITVELNDGRKVPAELVSADATADLALLKISDAKNLPVLSLGDSADLMPGEPVIAVGNPLGYSHSVSTGIVSAVHRTLKDDNGQVLMPDLIQTDAAINPGNSGGPLLNAYGQVIGINTAIRGDAQNIGFAIPVNKLRDLIPELMDPANVAKIELPLKLTEKRTITPPANIAIQIHTAEPKQQAIDTINGHHPTDIIDAYTQILADKAHPITIRFVDGAEQTITPHALPQADPSQLARKKLGITVEQITPETAQQYGLDIDSGLLITEVLRNSVAGHTGLEPGDVLVLLGRYRVQSLKDLGTLLPHVPEKGRVYVAVIRGGHRLAGWLQF